MMKQFLAATLCVTMVFGFAAVASADAGHDSATATYTQSTGGVVFDFGDNLGVVGLVGLNGNTIDDTLSPTVDGGVPVQYDSTTLAYFVPAGLAPGIWDQGPIIPSGLSEADLGTNYGFSYTVIGSGGSTPAPFIFDGGTGGGNTAPTAVINGPFSADVLVDAAAVFSLSAAGSSDPESDALTYKWDLDGDGTFEVDTAGDDFLDVDAIDLARGAFSIGVRVSDGEFFSTASTQATVTPEPGSLALAFLGLMGIAAGRRRRVA